MPEQVTNLQQPEEELPIPPAPPATSPGQPIQPIQATQPITTANVAGAPKPGAIAQAMPTAPAPTVEPTTVPVAEAAPVPVLPTVPTVQPLPKLDPKKLVEGRVAELVSTRSPLQELARTRARQQAQSRGILSSTMAEQAGTQAVLAAALPIAQSEAEIALQQQQIGAQQAEAQAGREFQAEQLRYQSEVATQQQVRDIQAQNQRLDQEIAAAEERLLTQVGAEREQTMLQIQANKELQTTNNEFVSRLEAQKAQYAEAQQLRDIHAQNQRLDQEITAAEERLLTQVGAEREQTMLQIQANKDLQVANNKFLFELETQKAEARTADIRLQLQADSDRLATEIAAAEKRLATQIGAEREQTQMQIAANKALQEANNKFTKGLEQARIKAQNDNLLLQIDADNKRLSQEISAAKERLATQVGADRRLAELKIAADERALATSNQFQRELENTRAMNTKANLATQIAADSKRLTQEINAAKDRLRVTIGAEKERLQAQITADEATQIRNNKFLTNLEGIKASNAKEQLQIQIGAQNEQLDRQIAADKERLKTSIGADKERLQMQITANSTLQQDNNKFLKDIEDVRHTNAESLLSTEIMADINRLNLQIKADKERLATSVGADKERLQIQIASNETLQKSNNEFLSSLEKEKFNFQKELVTLDNTLKNAGITGESAKVIRENYTQTVTNTNAAFDNQVLQIQGRPASEMSQQDKKTAINEIELMRQTALANTNTLYRASPEWNASWEIVPVGSGLVAGQTQPTGTTSTKQFKYGGMTFEVPAGATIKPVSVASALGSRTEYHAFSADGVDLGNAKRLPIAGTSTTTQPTTTQPTTTQPPVTRAETGRTGTDSAKLSPSQASSFLGKSPASLSNYDKEVANYYGGVLPTTVDQVRSLDTYQTAKGTFDPTALNTTGSNPVPVTWEPWLAAFSEDKAQYSSLKQGLDRNIRQPTADVLQYAERANTLVKYYNNWAKVQKAAGNFADAAAAEKNAQAKLNEINYILGAHSKLGSSQRSTPGATGSVYGTKYSNAPKR